MLLIILMMLATYAQADLVDDVKQFFQNKQTGQLSFIQIDHSVDGKVIREVTGQLSFKRPNKLHWSYQGQEALEIISDGKTLWHFDPGLKQVVIREISQDLGAVAPSALFASGDLSASFQLKALESKDDLVWVEAKPYDQSQLTLMRIGMRQDKTLALKRIEIVDQFDRIAQIQFSNVHWNVNLLESEFSFIVPEGVEVLIQ